MIAPRPEGSDPPEPPPWVQKPTPEEIAERAAEIRAGWDEATREKRLEGNKFTGKMWSRPISEEAARKATGKRKRSEGTAGVR